MPEVPKEEHAGEEKETRSIYDATQREDTKEEKDEAPQNDPTMQTAYASMPVKPRDVTGDTEQEEEMPVQKEKEALEEDKEKT